MSISSDDNTVHDKDQLWNAEGVPSIGDEESISRGSDEDKNNDGLDADAHSLTPSRRHLTIEIKAPVSTPVHVKSEQTNERTESESAVVQSTSGNNDANADEDWMDARDHFLRPSNPRLRWWPIMMMGHQPCRITRCATQKTMQMMWCMQKFQEHTTSTSRKNAKMGLQAQECRPHAKLTRLEPQEWPVRNTMRALGARQKMVVSIKKRMQATIWGIMERCRSKSGP